MSVKIKIGIAEDQNIFRESLVELFENSGEFELLIEAANGQLFLEKLSGLDEPLDIALLDLDMPVLNGIQVCDRLRAQYPSVNIIILSVYDQKRYIARLITSGASAYLTKTCGKAELFTAIRSVYNNGFYMNKETMEAIRDSSSQTKKNLKNIDTTPFELTPREKEVLLLICREYTSPDIAAKLFISIPTVNGHRNKLLAKTGSHNTAGLILFALKNHLFDPLF